MLSVAAELADIVHIATPFLGIAYMRGDVTHVLKVAAENGRAPGDFEIDMTIALSVSDDREFARSTAKLIAAVGILWMANAERRDVSGELVSKKARETPEEFHVPESTVDAISREWNMWNGEQLSDKVAGLIDDNVLRQFAVAGTASECLDRLIEIKAALPDITGFRFKLPPLTGQEAFARHRKAIELIGGFVSELGNR